jgi:HD-GYP domain-containing protein (c-di-GMP phosphodiesterase class II)
MIPASVAAIESAGVFLRGLSSATQSYRLYPPGHPDRRTAATELVEEALRMRDRLGADPSLFRSRHRFYLGRTLLAWESLTLLKLADAFESAGIESIDIRPSLSERDIDALVAALTGESQPPEDLDGLVINMVDPDARPDTDNYMTELLNNYAMGLELLRETGARLLAGEPGDMDATSQIAARFADQISFDPAQALLLTTVKSHDEYTYHHMINVCILSLALGNAVGLDRESLLNLGIGALLHDVGKVKVPQEILQTEGPLNEEQWRLIQRHPVDGTGLILFTSRDLYHPAATVVLEHHAAYDTSGYPSLRGRRQPTLGSRLVSVADCFDAVTSARPYRKAEERRQALALLQAGAGKGFDPRVVRAFVRMMGLFPIGSLVELETGEVGIVVRNHEKMLAHPIVKQLFDKAGNPSEPNEIDMSERGSDGGFRWRVTRTLDPRDLGIDMLQMLSSNELDTMPIHQHTGPGLMHEPSPGEEPPPGWVEAHPEPGSLEIDAGA